MTLTLRLVVVAFLLPFPIRAEVTLNVHDDSLQMTLMAKAPEIRNPIGVAVDHDDRIYVIESHTSLRPSDYDGPKSDRIRMIVDRDHDGEPERFATAAEDLQQAMSLAVSPHGLLYVVCAREIIALLDHNGDGVFDSRKTIVSLDTSYQHPHYRLTGIAFDEDGRLCFSRGNMGGYAYTVRGSDGAEISGYGDGGSILRCQPGGTELEQVATGFWNVMGMDHDGQGRLLAADNDPESRGPNRLLHIVPGGDYGYQTLYGKGGHHPLQSWEGELPGTLPMVSTTREAPSGVLACRRTSLPKGYANSVLVSCWGESVIERHQMQPDGMSVSANSSVLVSGSDEFRPVAMATDSKGAIYISDWASSRYSNHGDGRLWRLTSKQVSKDNLQPTKARSMPETDAQNVLTEIRKAHLPIDGTKLLNLFTHDDPFMTHALVESLAKPVFWSQLLDASKDTTASIRLGALLALRQAHHPDAVNLVSRFLGDSNQLIRMTALRWVTELQDPQLRPALEEAIVSSEVSLMLLETYLSAKSALSPAVLEARSLKSVPSTFDIPFPSESKSLQEIIASEASNDQLRAIALMRIGSTNDPDLFELLTRWAREMNPTLQMAAIQGLGQMEEAVDRRMEVLKSAATNPSYDAQVRADAIATWARLEPAKTEWVLPLLDDHKEAVRLGAARALRLAGQLEPTLSKLKEFYLKVRDNPREAPVAEQLEFILYGPHAEDKKFASQRPQTLEEWQDQLQLGGDVNGGRRLFYSAGLLCSQCHTPGAFKNSLGPSLENLGQSVDRGRIIQSLIEPSKNFSPAYQAWRITTKDGVTEPGVQLDWALDGSLKFIGFEGNEVILPATEVTSYTPLEHSIMPHGLQELMTVREMRELVSFLESLGDNID